MNGIGLVLFFSFSLDMRKRLGIVEDMKSNLYKNGYCLVLEIAGEKTRIAPYSNVRPAYSSIWANNTGKRVGPAIWVNSTELETTREQLAAAKIESIKKASLALVK